MWVVQRWICTGLVVGWVWVACGCQGKTNVANTSKDGQKRAPRLAALSSSVRPSSSISLSKRSTWASTHSPHLQPQSTPGGKELPSGVGHSPGGLDNTSGTKHKARGQDRFASQTKPAMFSFASGLEGWKGWGNGEGFFQPNLGHQQPGSLSLSCLDNQSSYTFYRHIHGLKPGRYQISAWLRGLDIQPGHYNESVWVFADGGHGIHSPVKNLTGTFSWSRLVFTMEVKDSSLTVWFRLKSQGQLWVDDVDIQAYRGKKIPFSWLRSTKAMPVSEPLGHGVLCQRCYRWWKTQQSHCLVCGAKTTHAHGVSGYSNRHVVAKTRSPQHSEPSTHPKRRILFDFERESWRQEQRFHTLREYRNRATSGRHSAVIRYGVYNNISVTDPVFANWSGFHILAMDVYNPLPQHVAFQLCVNDKPHADYWDQLNHVARLAPGWNRLQFSLRRYVGERGSVRFQRYVNLSRIRRFWFAVAAEQKPRTDVEFLVDFVRLEQSNPAPQSFPGLHRFDFVAQRFHTQSGFVGVTPQQTYRQETGFGFQNLRVWRLLDSQYADTLLRDAILSTSGSFRVDLPNGTYEVHLFARHLGYWYEHFWKRQDIWIQGKPWIRLRRNHAKDYLKDVLRFQDVEPKPSDNAYDLYLRPLLAAYRITVRVRDGKLLLRWQGDGSGVPLNALVLYPVQEKAKGHVFLQQLYQQQRDEFANVARKLEPLAKVESGAIQANDRQRGFYTALLNPSDYLRYNWILRSRSEGIQWAGGWGQRPMQAFMVRILRNTPAQLQVSVSALRNTEGHKIRPSQMSLRYGVQQFVGHEMNHETYELAPRWLQPFPKEGLMLPGRHSLLMWLQLPLQKTMPAGVYRGTLTIQLMNQRVDYPIRLVVYPFALPDVDIPVGYFGLDPVPFDSFDAPGVKEQKYQWRKQVLQILRDRGFSTWSSLPKSRVSVKRGRLLADVRELKELLSMAERVGFHHPIFSYGGGFLDDLLQVDQRGMVVDLSQENYRKQSARLLRQILKKYPQTPFIYNFTDEASGYSQMVERDEQRAKLLRTHYPFLRTGGFSHSIKSGEYGYGLNLRMTDISLSSVTREQVQALKEKGVRWGLYNAAIGSFDVGRSTFGEALFTARYYGASHRLAWHLTGAQNYPYYDLDGRENDAMMLYPRTDGQLHMALKLEWATQGLEDYRLLLLLERVAQQAGQRGYEALLWIAQRYKEVDFFATPHYLQAAESRRTDAYSKKFRSLIYRQLIPLLRQGRKP